jgi:DMSO/TMAO reductase YedYZ molybdopterin-dependent catalytic subunit
MLLAMIGTAVAGVAFGARVQSVVGNAVGSGLGGLIPGGDRFRIYSITGSYPDIRSADYRLKVTGLVDRPLELTLDDLLAMPKVELVRDFQCVTGWRVPHVHWAGVRLSDVLDLAGVRAPAAMLAFNSYDGLDTESLTIAQARLPDVIVAYRMLGAPITREHGGPVRLYVAPMFGYKSIKWLREITVVQSAPLGYWEHDGFPADAWFGSLQRIEKSLV